MPQKTDIERRDHALIAFAIVSGARDRAIVSFRLKHIDIEQGVIQHDSREVRTKRAKTFTTWFFPVGEDFRKIVVDWVTFLGVERGFGADDPLFPKTKVGRGDDLAFRAAALDRAPWANANPVREFSVKHVRGRASRTSTRIRCGTPSFRSLTTGSWTPRLSRRGRKISDMKAA